MENKNFENNIIHAFKHYQPELDNDEIWENIEPHLKKKKKRRFIIFWFLLGGLGLAYFLLNNTGELPSSKDEKIIAENSPPVISETDTSLGDLIVAKENSETLVNDQLAEKDSPPVLELPSSKYVSKNSTFKSDHKKLPPENDGIIINKNNSLAEISKDNNNETARIEGFEINSVAIEGTQLNVGVSESIDDTIETNTEFTEDTSEDVSPAPEESASKKKKVKKKKVKKDKNDEEEKQKIKPLKKNQWDHYMQFTVAPILSLRSMSTNGFGHQAFAKQRIENEKRLEAFGINIGYQLHHTNGLVIVSGLEYQQLNERFEKYFEETTSETVVGILTVTENAAEQIINTTSGPKAKETTVIRHYKFHNNYRFFNLPIGIGKSWSHKNHGYKFIGGLDYNLAFAFNGTVLSPELRPIKLKKGQPFSAYDDTFKKKAGIGFWLSGEYSHYINSSWQWVVAPKLQIPLSPITQQEYELTQRYYRFSIDLGFKYFLNRDKKKKS